MAKAQSWRGPDTRQSNYSEDFFTLRELWWQFCVLIGENGMVFSSNFTLFSLGNSCIAQ